MDIEISLLLSPEASFWYACGMQHITENDVQSTTIYVIVKITSTVRYI